MSCHLQMWVFPTAEGIILCDHNHQNQDIKIDYLLILRSYASFDNCPYNAFYSQKIQSRTTRCILLSRLCHVTLPSLQDSSLIFFCLDFYNFNMFKNYTPVILYNVSQFQFVWQEYQRSDAVLLRHPIKFQYVLFLMMFMSNKHFWIYVYKDFSVSHSCCPNLHA